MNVVVIIQRSAANSLTDLRCIFPLIRGENSEHITKLSFKKIELLSSHTFVKNQSFK